MTISPDPLVVAAFSPSPSLRVGLHSPSPPVAFARLSIQLGAMRSKSSQVPLLRPLVFLHLLHCMGSYCVRVRILLQNQMRNA